MLESVRRKAAKALRTRSGFELLVVERDADDAEEAGGLLGLKEDVVGIGGEAGRGGRGLAGAARQAGEMRAGPRETVVVAAPMWPY